MPTRSTLGGDVEGALKDISIPSYVLDTSGVIRWVNAAAIRIVGDVRGRQFTSVVSPEARRTSREVFARKVAGTARVTDVEVVVIDHNGERQSVEVSSVPLVRGERVIGVFGQVIRQPADSPLAAHPALTPRQTEVLRMLERGLSTRQIADELHLSRETVRNHVRNMMKTLGVHTRLEAVAMAHHRKPSPAT
jgi:PAS domain S-box-containing protein